MDRIDPVVKQEPTEELGEIVKPKEEKKPEQTEEGGQFQCALCGWSERYHGHGTSLPFARGINFNEDAYVMRDPFVPYGQNLYFFLGAPCSGCQRLVCANCSLFYSKRFCGECANKNVQHFPVEVQKKIHELKTNKSE